MIDYTNADHEAWRKYARQVIRTVGERHGWLFFELVSALSVNDVPKEIVDDLELEQRKYEDDHAGDVPPK